MSKQSEAKEKQKFIKKPAWPICATCPNFSFDIETRKSSWGSQQWNIEKKLRCKIGGFKVTRTDTCNEHPGRRQEIKESPVN